MNLSNIQSRIPEYCSYLGSKLETGQILPACSLFESVFYRSIKENSENQSSAIKWIQETSIGYIDEIQQIFNAINFVGLVSGSAHLFNVVWSKYAISSNNYGRAALLSTTFFVGALVFFRYRLESEKETTSSFQKNAKTLHIAKVVLNLGLASLSKNRFYFLVNALGTGYSLFKNSKIKWFVFTKETPINDPNFNKKTTTYKMLEIRAENFGGEDKCAICYDDQITDANPAIYVCMKHVFHRDCFKGQLENGNQNLLNSRISSHSTKHYKSYVSAQTYTHTTTSYLTTFEKKNLPACSVCTLLPSKYSTSVEISGIGHRANVKVCLPPPVKKSDLFEKAYAIYNIAQACLNYLQTYSEFSPTIFKINQFMIFTDLLALGFTFVRINEKLEENKTHDARFKVMACSIATSTLPYFTLYDLNKYVKPLKLNKYIPNIDAKWKNYTSHEVMKFLYIARIISTLALSYLSSNKKVNFLNIASLAASLFNSLKLRWISVSMCFKPAYDKLIETSSLIFSNASYVDSLGKFYYKSINSTAKFKVISNFMVAPSQVQDKEYLQSISQLIHEYANNLFKDYTWSTVLVRNANFPSNLIRIEYTIHFKKLVISPLISTLNTTIKSLSDTASARFFTSRDQQTRTFRLFSYREAILHS